MISSALGIAWEALKGAVVWMVGYNKPPVIEARIITNENKEADKLNQALQDETEASLDVIRRAIPK